MGRILGPRGMTAKQLEQETGCKIMVRGKGSMRDKKKVSFKTVLKLNVNLNVLIFKNFINKIINCENLNLNTILKFSLELGTSAHPSF